MSRISFDDALDTAIDALLAGERADAVLTRFPRHSGALAPLLETIEAARPAPPYEPPSARLAENFARIERTLTYARSQAPAPAISHNLTARARSRAPWWRRRVAFASMSLPAGVLALALVGAGGAAAATVATTTDLPGRLAEQVEQVTPSWTHSLIPGGQDADQAPATVDATPTSVAPGAVTTVATDATPVPGSTRPPASPHVGPPQEITANGAIANVRGNTFELVTGDVTYKVQLDPMTFVAGAIVEDASASVTGALTGNDRLHATAVQVTQPASSTPPQSGPAPLASPTEHVPPGQADKTTTPPGLEDKTKPPGPPEDPPGQAEDGPGNGNGNGGGNGNNGNHGGNGIGGGNGNGNGGGNGNGNGGGNGGNP